ncbi:MAG: DUF192 domain-containing protein [Saprospiraceae bacterium]|uniref:DUF192 domain-containing protein n=1 Tax=Candidatus Defluviibacterium haderslevense TaxID=2981993 RepID=A0A9D7S5X2_9BACT|nr:DUF192 domain-containing protein [Candidatus Defluviibacterium haderslevense]
MKRKLKFAFAIVFLVLTFLFYLRITEKSNENHPVSTEYIIPFKIDGEFEFLDSLKNRIATISVEIADDEYEITTGLMDHKTMAASLGMLFVFPTSEQRSFWMKNTYIPLDILFVNKKLEIVSIQKYTQPFSESPIPSGSEAKYVIELNAGYCDLKKIKEGQVVHFSFKNKNII